LNQFSNINPLEKIISSLSYLTAGMAGFIWLIIAAFMKKTVKPFLMYHIMQSIFLSIAYFLFIELYKLFFIVIAKVPIINSILFLFNSILFNPLPLFWGMSLFQVFTTTVVLYLAITSLLGKYSYIPYVSDIIKRNVGR